MGDFDPTDRDLAALLGAWDTGGPGYLALARSLQSAILDGRLALRGRLPSERALARSLDVSRTTTTSAYDVLRASGFIESRQGSGSRTSLPRDATVDRELPSAGIGSAC